MPPFPRVSVNHGLRIRILVTLESVPGIWLLLFLYGSSQEIVILLTRDKDRSKLFFEKSIPRITSYEKCRVRLARRRILTMKCDQDSVAVWINFLGECKIIEFGIFFYIFLCQMHDCSTTDLRSTSSLSSPRFIHAFLVHGSRTEKRATDKRDESDGTWGAQMRESGSSVYKVYDRATKRRSKRHDDIGVNRRVNE